MNGRRSENPALLDLAMSLKGEGLSQNTLGMVGLEIDVSLSLRLHPQRKSKKQPLVDAYTPVVTDRVGLEDT